MAQALLSQSHAYFFFQKSHRCRTNRQQFNGCHRVCYADQRFGDYAGLLFILAGVALMHVTGNATYGDIITLELVGLISGDTITWLVQKTKNLLIGKNANPQLVERRHSAYYQG